MRFILITLLLFMSGGDAIAAEMPPLFAPGEELIYDVYWSGFYAGKTRMTIEQSTTERHKVTLQTESQGFLESIVRVRDSSVSEIAADGSKSFGTKISISEGNYKKEKRMAFDYDRNRATYDEGGESPSEHKIGGPLHDPLSAIYALRTHRGELKNGATFLIPVFDEGKNYELEVKFIRREKLHLPAGAVDTIVVRIKLKYHGAYEERGAMTLWLNDDAILMQMEKRESFGHFTAKLRAWRGIDLSLK